MKMLILMVLSTAGVGLAMVPGALAATASAAVSEPQSLVVLAIVLQVLALLTRRDWSAAPSLRRLTALASPRDIAGARLGPARAERPAA